MWKELSEVLQQRVTKKNLSLVLKKLELNRDLILLHNPLIKSNENKRSFEKIYSKIDEI